MRYQIEEYVRWEDIDAAGIINYQAYLRFFGLAEAELYRSCGLSYREMFDEVGVWLPRVHVESLWHPRQALRSEHAWLRLAVAAAAPNVFRPPPRA